MSKRAKRSKGYFKPVSFLVVCLLAFSLIVGTGIAEGNVSRIGGANRYETSALVAGEGYSYANTVIIARGDQAGQFADGLASSLLSGVLNVPVLLTEPGALPDSIRKAITNLGATRALVLGGTEAVSNSVVDELKSLGLTVNRIGGKNRYETAAKIAEEAKKRGALGNYALIVNGFATADSLVAAPAAFKNRVPILLVTQNTIPEETKQALRNLGINQVYIIGGTAVVSNSVENNLSGMVMVRRRLGGADRYATSVALAEELFSGKANLILAGGLNANLVDSIGACIFGQPILYVRQDAIPSAVNNYLGRIVSAGSTVKIIGGEAAVSPGVSREAGSIIDSKTGGGGSSSTGPSRPRTTQVSAITITTTVTGGESYNPDYSLPNFEGVTVKLETATEDADIYYTLDGNNPTMSSTKYTDSFVVDNSDLDEPENGGTVVLKAIAVKSGYNNSAVATLEIKFDAELDKHTVSFSVVGGNGTLVAKTQNPFGWENVTSGEEVYEGTEIVFTATPAAGYQVKEWTVDGSAVSDNKTNSLTVEDLSAATAVTVEFEKLAE